MPKHAKDFGADPLPKDLPMPKYEYQKPSSESFTLSFSEQRDLQSSEKPSDFCLQNTHLTI